MPALLPVPFPRGVAALALLALAGSTGAHATTDARPPDAAPADPRIARITQVTLYPGSATVERVAHIAAGSRVVSFACLPAGLDVQSLQVSADASVRLGETSVHTAPRALSPRCAANNALDGRIRELETRKDALQAETDALDLVTGYLNEASGARDETPSKRPAPDAKGLAAMAEALHRTGQDALLKQRQLARQQADLDQQLTPLLAERAQAPGQGDAVIAVSVTLAAGSDADVRLSYQIPGPGWTPSYRALLDTSTRKLRLERQALVAQATGEDWRGVRLLLSTGQPRRETAGRLPTPWRLGIELPQPRGELARDRAAATPAAAPAPGMAKAMAVKAEPLFDLSVFEAGFATEFKVPQPVDVPSGGQRVALSLGQVEDTATLAVRTSPRLDASAFLVAETAWPKGVWPAGPMQLYRDGAFVGTGRWSALAEPRLVLSFGRDELVRVQAEPEQDNRGTGGLMGGRSERQLQRAYVIENRHRTPIAVQVLEAAPVPVDEQVRVTTRFDPKPAELAWNKQPGVAMWAFELGAERSARLAADYVISVPKELRLQER